MHWHPSQCWPECPCLRPAQLSPWLSAQAAKHPASMYKWGHRKFPGRVADMDCTLRGSPCIVASCIWCSQSSQLQRYVEIRHDWMCHSILFLYQQSSYAPKRTIAFTLKAASCLNPRDILANNYHTLALNLFHHSLVWSHSLANVVNLTESIWHAWGRQSRIF